MRALKQTRALRAQRRYSENDGVPAAWLQALGNPSPSQVTDLGTWHAPEAASMGQLLADIQRRGMRDPFL